jgi:hypothetical protein
LAVETGTKQGLDGRKGSCYNLNIGIVPKRREKMKVKIKGFTIKVQANRKGFSISLDTPKDKCYRAEIRRTMNNVRVRLDVDTPARF